MVHPYHKHRDGAARAKRFMADGGSVAGNASRPGGVAGVLEDKAADAKEDVTDHMRAGADDISNNPKTESGNTYSARLRMRGN